MRRDGERAIKREYVIRERQDTSYLLPCNVIDSFKGDLSEIRKSDRRRGEIERGRRTGVHVS